MQNVWYKKVCLEPLTWSFPTEATFLLRDEIQNKNFRLRITFQIQIFGTVDDLSDYLGVDFQAVGIAVVPRDDNIVPLVVIQGAVTVAFDHIGTIAEIKHIVYVPTRDRKKKKSTQSLQVPWNVSVANTYISKTRGFKSPMQTWPNIAIKYIEKNCQ